MKINKLLRMLLRRPKSGGDTAVVEPMFKPPEIMSGVVPSEVKVAMDSGLADVYAYANQHMCLGRESFMGYARLAQLAQKAEFRSMAEKPAEAMTRKWIEFKSVADDDMTEIIKAIEAEMKRLKVRELFREMAIQDGLFGRSQLFVDLGDVKGPELETPMFMHEAKLLGKLRKFKLVESMYSYPVDWRADNPLSDDYYNPMAWYVMGQKVHASRLLLFVGRPLPDLLKPAYNFGGMSMSQLAIPYVENWISTRESVNRLIRNFSITGIATDMSATLAGDTGEDLIERAELYNAMRDTQGLFVMNKDTEEMFQYNVPLGTLDKLQAQSQEHMSSVSSMPLVVFFGVTPTGLNASSEGEIRTWYDYIKDRQEALFRPNLSKVIEIIQLSLFGKTYPAIDFDFVDLWQPNAVEIEQARKTRAETDQTYFDMGVISAEEIRSELSNDADSGYTGLPDVPPDQLIPPGENDDDETTGTGKESDSAETDSPKPGK